MKSPDEKARELYDIALVRWGTEPSFDKNQLKAKAIATFVVDEIIKVQPFGTYWIEVKEEIQKL